MCKALACGSQTLLWYLHKLDEGNPNKDEMRALRKRLNDMMTYCHDLLFHQQDKVGEEVSNACISHSNQPYMYFRRPTKHAAACKLQ